MSISIVSATIGPIFNGSYEQNGTGYGGPGVVYGDGGTASSTTLGGYTMFSVDIEPGAVWYGGGGTYGTVLILLMDPSTPLNFAVNLVITDPASNVYTYALADATTFTVPPAGSALTAFQGFYWNVQSANEFVSGQTTLVDAPLPPTISLVPTSITMNYGASELFAATTTNPSDASVTWSCLYGTVDVIGNYTAPAQSSGHTADTVTAALTDSPDVLATAAVTLQYSTRTVAAGSRLPGAFPPALFAKAGTINPKVYMPVEDTTVVAK